MQAPLDPIAFWNGEAAERWLRLGASLDRALGPFGIAAADAARVAEGERVLDVGCGCGDTALMLAGRVGGCGLVQGIDVSAPLVARARERAAARANVQWLLGDAATAPLEPASWDVLFSRFGVMFFADRLAAFQHLRRALRAGGRLSFVCWRALQESAFFYLPLGVASRFVRLPEPTPPDAPGPFSLAEAAVIREVLGAAGFVAVGVEALDLPVLMGDTPAQAADFALETGPLSRALADVDAATREKTRAAIRAALEPRAGERGVTLTGAAWLVTARAGRPCDPERPLDIARPRATLSRGTMLVDDLKARMFLAMKAGNTVEKEILRVALGEITTAAARPGARGGDEEAMAALRKIIKSNEETLAASESADQKAQLEQENRVLASFLPRTLGVGQIVEELAAVSAELRAAGNDGQATGIAMKHLRAAGAPVTGKDVAEAVKRVRAAS